VCLNTYHTNERAERTAGGGALFGLLDDPRNLRLKVPANTNTPEEAELNILYLAIKETPKNKSLHLQIKSKSIIRDLTLGLQRNEQTDWLGNKNKNVLKAIVSELRQQMKETILIKSTPQNNMRTHQLAGDLAQEAILRPNDDNLKIKPEPSYELRGLELTAATQVIFYKSLREQKRKESTRLRTTIRLDITRYAVEEFNKNFQLTNKYGTHWRTETPHETWQVSSTKTSTMPTELETTGREYQTMSNERTALYAAKASQ